MILLGAAGLAVAAWDVATGGFYVTIAGLRVSSREAYKPFRIGMLASVAAIWLREWVADPEDTVWQRLPAWAPRLAVAVAVLSLLAALRFGVAAAGGSDAYGYVSQASLWANGRVVVPDPLAALEPALGEAVAPVGYRLATTPGAIVPMYPPGLPMTMAIALKAGGSNAVFLVVPLLGAIAVWLTYRLGAGMHQEVTGLIAAILLAFSPIFVFHTFQPMSDVAVTAWWMLAWVLAVASGAWPCFGSGLAVSAAILTRPNLLPLAVVLAAVNASQAPRVRRLALFAAGTIPGGLILAAVNWRLYGSPLSSGYGPVALLYAWTNWRANVQHYGQWLIELNSPFILLAALAPLVARVRSGAAMLVFFFVLAAGYLWYSPFATWPFLRFFLPAIPLLLILSAAVFVRGATLLPRSLRAPAVFILCTLLPIHYVSTSNQLGMFRIRRAEHRYVAVGRHIARALPPNAVVVSTIQSGSIRLYGDRLTVRWDMLPADQLDAAVRTLEAAGYRPYLLLEDWELPLFRDLFRAANQYGRVDWPPAFEYRDIGKLWIYDFADRARYFAGVNVSPRPVPLDAGSRP